MINVGIVGYGNLGRGVCLAINKNEDMNLTGIFTRRNPDTVNPVVKTKVYSVNELPSFKGKIDVLILCGGSATDLPNTTKNYLKDFCTVDSFDTHAKIPEYLQELDKIGKENNTLCGISIGWDPGLFSMVRALTNAVLPSGKAYTFWGKGVSQGHSDAIRRIDGVLKAVQYTIPKESAINGVKSGEMPNLKSTDMHDRECYVVAKDGADKQKIENEIKNMPNYFSGYNTTVHFINEKEFNDKHTKLAHGGFVLGSGETSEGTKELIEFSLKLDSNPEFTGSVITAFARAIYKLYKEGKTGALTVLDVPISYLSKTDRESLIKTLL